MPVLTSRNGRFSEALRRGLMGPQVLAFLPAITLGSFWLGGEACLMFVSFLVPALFAAAGGFSRRSETGPHHHTGKDLQWGDSAVARIGKLLAAGENGRKTTAILAVGIDDFATVTRTVGPAGQSVVLETVAARLAGAVRDTDLVTRMGASGFLIVISTRRRAETDIILPLATRLQAVVAEPISLGNSRIFATVSVGYALASKSGLETPRDCIDAAALALEVAQGSGNACLREYDRDMRRKAAASADLTAQVVEALDAGHIAPWFQPQINAATGALTGAEALARWDHPDRGMISPAEFLPVIERAGLAERFGDAMLNRSLAALRQWQAAGTFVPEVSVNFSAAELRNPYLVDKVKWALENNDLEPSRLRVEVLETVIASTGHDTVVRNLWALSELGCRIDLDDFGTGHAAIGNIRRFAIGRLKIDRSFVSQLDRDEDQQSMVGAILVMAERLEIETLAEGVETPREAAILRRLGCGYLQGFGIARPMPQQELRLWADERARSHRPSADLHSPPDGQNAALITLTQRAIEGKTA